jgi:MoaA/NifB/PqqE/SkfB family radical SAM enzyme
MKRTGNVVATWQDWVNAFNRIGPQIMDITGGEPFMNKNLVDIINGLSCKIGLTTNLSQNILEFVQKVSPSKVVSITVSYHPSQVMTQEAFIGKALLLANRGFNVTVNFVAHPEQLFLIPAARALFESMGLRFHVDPFATDNQNRFEYSDREKQFLAPFVQADREFRIKDVQKNVKCSGGRNYLQVDPDGFAYRCMTMHLTHEAPLGNILDPLFKVNKSDAPCSIADLCGGCDRDKVTISNA